MENHGIVILKCRYYEIKRKLIQAEEEMCISPNQYSDAAIRSLSKDMKEVEQCLNVLGVQINN